MRKVLSVLLVFLVIFSFYPSQSHSQSLAVKTDYLNVRNGVWGRVIGLIKEDQEFDVLGSSKDFNGKKWYKIKYGSTIGWVHSNYVKLSSNHIAKGTYTVTVTDLRARSGPSTSYRVKGSLSKGKTYKYYEQRGNWLKLKYNNGYVWAHAGYGSKKRNNDNHRNMKKNKERIKIKKSDIANYAKFIKVPIDINDFAEFQLDRSVVWRDGGIWKDATLSEIKSEMNPSNISLFNETIDSGSKYNVLINTNILNVRSGPSINNDIISRVYRGQKYKVIDRDGVWRKITLGGGKGWIHSNYIKPVDLKSKTVKLQEHILVLPNELFLRKGPGTNYKAIDVLNKGEIYPVLNETDKWIKIKTKETEGWVSSSYVELTQGVNRDMYQFLDLKGSTDISEEELNSVLSDKGILDSKGSAFIKASKMYNVNEMYLVSHALLETGNGTSTLAKGCDYTNSDGETVTVYNMYGIGAYDSDPIACGKKYAYKQGWTTPEKAIIGGAKWISENYINTDHEQNTLYKMRWNYETRDHQYATDVGWARKQVNRISDFYKKISGYKLKFEIPIFD